MKYLLATWEIILNGLHEVKLGFSNEVQVKDQDRDILYRFITYIAYRKEFYLVSTPLWCHGIQESNGFDIRYIAVKQCRLPYLKRFIYLLRLTLIEAITLLKNPSSALPLRFASKIVLLSCICIPSVGKVVYTGLLQSQPPLSKNVPDIRFDIFNDEDFHQFESVHRIDSVLSEASELFEIQFFSLSFAQFQIEADEWFLQKP